MKEHSIDIQLSHPDDLFHLFGSNERHLRLMEQELDVVIHARTEIVQVIGQEEDCEKARQVIEAYLGESWHDYRDAGCCNSYSNGS